MGVFGLVDSRIPFPTVQFEGVDQFVVVGSVSGEFKFNVSVFMLYDGYGLPWEFEGLVGWGVNGVISVAIGVWWNVKGTGCKDEVQYDCKGDQPHEDLVAGCDEAKGK